MALLWLDGFDHYGDDETLMMSGSYAAISNTSLNSVKFRTGSRGIFINTGLWSGIRRIFGANKQRVGVGYAMLIDALPGGNDRVCLAAFRDAANAEQCRLILSTTGAIELVSGASRGISAPCITTGSFHHVEIAVTIHNTAGACEVRVNGDTVLDLTGIDTQWQSTLGTDQVHIGQADGHPSAAAPWYLDDLFAWDTEGDLNNSFIGDTRVYTLLPTSDDTPVDWVPSTGTDLYAMIDDPMSDEAATFITAPDVGLEAQFNMADLPTEVITIAGATVITRAKKSAPGDNKIRPALIVGSETLEGAEFSVNTNYTTFTTVFNGKAAGAFTKADINAAKLNLKRTA